MIYNQVESHFVGNDKTKIKGNYRELTILDWTCGAKKPNCFGLLRPQERLMRHDAALSKKWFIIEFPP